MTRRRSSRPRGAALTSLLLSLVLAACASGGSQMYADDAYGAASPEAAVGAFLDALQQSDYRVMANLFGTRDGPAERRWGRAEVEQRMFVLAGVLSHASYELRRLNLTEGPDRVRVIADLVGTANGAVAVPFITARNQDRWFVEQVVTETLGRG